MISFRNNRLMRIAGLAAVLAFTTIILAFVTNINGIPLAGNLWPTPTVYIEYFAVNSSHEEGALLTWRFRTDPLASGYLPTFTIYKEEYYGEFMDRKRWVNIGSVKAREGRTYLSFIDSRQFTKSGDHRVCVGSGSDNCLLWQEFDNSDPDGTGPRPGGLSVSTLWEDDRRFTEIFSFPFSPFAPRQYGNIIDHVDEIYVRKKIYVNGRMRYSTMCTHHDEDWPERGSQCGQTAGELLTTRWEEYWGNFPLTPGSDYRFAVQICGVWEFVNRYEECRDWMFYDLSFPVDPPATDACRGFLDDSAVGRTVPRVRWSALFANREGMEAEQYEVLRGETTIGIISPDDRVTEEYYEFADTTPMTLGEERTYTVRATNEHGSSVCTIPFHLTDAPPPPSPSDLIGVKQSESEEGRPSVTLSWRHEGFRPVDDLMGKRYSLWYAVNESGPFRQIAVRDDTYDLDFMNKRFPGVQLLDGVTNYFYVTADNALRESEPSNVVAVEGPPLSAPVIEKVEYRKNAHGIHDVVLYWRPYGPTPYAADDRQIRIEYSPTGEEGTFVPVVTMPPTGFVARELQEYVMTPRAPGYVRIVTVLDGRESAPSPVESFAWKPAPPLWKDSPRYVTDEQGRLFLELSWTPANSENEEAYVIEVASDMCRPATSCTERWTEFRGVTFALEGSTTVRYPIISLQNRSEWYYFRIHSLNRGLDWSYSSDFDDSLDSGTEVWNLYNQKSSGLSEPSAVLSFLAEWDDQEGLLSRSPEEGGPGVPEELEVVMHGEIPRLQWRLREQEYCDERRNNVFVTEGTYKPAAIESGELFAPADAPEYFRGVEGADALCGYLASEAGMQGSWKAIISGDQSAGTWASNRFMRIPGPVLNYNVDEEGGNPHSIEIASGYHPWRPLSSRSLWGSSGISSPIRYDQYGRIPSSGVNTVYTGTSAAGEATYTCDNWTNPDATADVGYRDRSDAGWITSVPESSRPQERPSCSEPRHLYCMRLTHPNEYCNADTRIEYVIETSDSSDGTYEEVTTVPFDRETSAGAWVVDDIPALGEERFYRVRTRNVLGQYSRDPSNVVRVAGPSLPPSVPEMPEALRGSFADGADGGFRLTWTDRSDNEEGFEIERRSTQTSPDWSQLGSVGPNIVEYLDASFGYAPLEYRIRAFNANGFSEWSDSATVIRIPQPPWNLAGSPVAEGIALTWEEMSEHEETFVILRAVEQDSDVDYVSIHQTDPNTTAYTDTAGIQKGQTYHYRILARNTGGDSQPSNTIIVTALPDPPAAPSALTLSTVGGTATILQARWTDNATNETGFKIERSLTGTEGSWTQVGTQPADVTTYNDSGLTANTEYHYRVRAYNAAGDSQFTSPQSIATPEVAPTAPADLAAVAVSSSRINLIWTDTSDNESSFTVERASSESGPWTPIGTTVTDVNTYESTDLAANTLYYFRVRAHNTIGDSDPVMASAMTHIFIPTPTSLNATSVSSTQIDLYWTDASNNESGFAVERKLLFDTKWIEVGRVAGNVTMYSDTGLTKRTSYDYRVRAFKDSMYSEYSNTESKTTPDTPPAPPSGLAASVISASQIDLAWTDRADNEDFFEIERKAGTDPWSFLRTVTANSTTFSNLGLQPVTTYSFRIRAYNAQGYSPYSDEVTAVTENGPPTFPYALSATQKVPASAFEINLTWSDGSNNENGFRIERKTGTNGTWEQAGLVGANLRTFKDTDDLTASATYHYRVFAYNERGDSPPSNLAGVTTADIAPANPQNPTAVPISASEIRIAWTDVSLNETGFRISYRKGTTTGWTQQDIAANLTEYTVTGLDSNTTYSFVVQAFNAIGVSYSGTQVTATTFDVSPSAPTALVATTLSQAQIRLAWTDNSVNNTHFVIERKTGETGTWNEIRTAAANDTHFTDGGLTVNTRYFYRIKAVNAVGVSEFSEADALTYDVAPPAPTRLRAIIVRESDLAPANVSLSWTDKSFNEAAFTVERKTGIAGEYASIGTVASDVTTYLDTKNLLGGSTYYYKVKATNAGGSSDYCHEVGITLAKPAEPQNPSAFALSDTQIRLSWSIWWQSNNVVEVKVKRAGVLIASIPYEDSLNMSFTDAHLTPNTTYVYGLETCNAYGCSAWNYPISATTRATFCPNGKKEIGEACDDGNSDPADGCSAICTVESGYTCNGTTPSICQKCGNSIKEGTETCDDGNANPDDGCSSACVVESEWICSEELPSICTRDLEAIVRRLMNIGPTVIPTVPQRVAFFSAMLLAEKSQNLPFDINADGVVNRQDTRLLMEGLRQIMGR